MSGIPHLVDHFEISRILGKGGMGTVYLARDLELDRHVAVKILNPEDVTEEGRARFFREGKTAAGIRHQNVATIFQVGETSEGQPFIVMEYCEGETLAQRLRRKPLAAGEFLSIATQIAAGVAAAHENGVVHRDIKSANIMIEPTGIVKILDFGLARLLPREIGGAGEKASFATTSGQFFGTLHYLAPEQTRGGSADERSDLFSVGVVMYQMASGHLPFNADAPLLILDKIRDAEPEPFVPVDSAFPPSAVKIVGKLLQKNPRDRYQSGRELLHDLEAIDSPTLRGTASHRSLLGRTIPRPRGGRVAVVAIALLIVVTTIFMVHRGSVSTTTEAATAAAAVAASTPIRSMAVLPLNNLANNERDDFLSVSLADALVTKLQQIPSLQVRPTSAILEFRKEKIDARTAAERLRVDSILEGHFLAAGELVRVTLQLTDSRTGYSVWATTVDGKRSDLLKLIDDVSQKTVTGLNDRLGVQTATTGGSAPRSSNPQAYEQYLRARSLTGSFVPSQYEAQIKALERAVDLDPKFAAAYADLAIQLSLGYARSLTTRPDTLAKAEWYARQAVRLDPNLAQAHLALGRVFVRDPSRYRESAREILTALRLNANDTHALNSVVTYFVSSGDLQRARCVGDRVVRLDPSSNEARTRGYWYVNAVDPEGALQNAQWALASKDTEVAGHDMRAVALILQGNLAEAQRETDAVFRLAPRHYLGKSLKAMIAAAHDDRNAAEAAVKSFESDANRNHWAAIRIAQVYARLGDSGQAVAWTQRATQLGHHSWYALVKHPWLQSLQGEPQFQEMVAKVKADLDDVQGDMIGVHNLICAN